MRAGAPRPKRIPFWQLALLGLARAVQGLAFPLGRMWRSNAPLDTFGLVHMTSVAGDALLAIALADSVFFSLPVGQAKLTRGYNLPARHVIHTVGPTIHGSVRPEDERLLESCYTACLDLAAQHQDIKVLAFCCISTGEFRFPKVPAAQIAVRTVCRWLQASGHHLHRVVFNVFTQEDHDVYAALLRQS